MKRFAAVIPTLAALVVALASFILSFVALRDVAAAVQAAPPSLAWLLPLVVDGGVLAASASLWSASYRKRKRDKVAYLTVAVLLGFSVVVNMSHAGPTPLAKAIAALPPIVLLACLELVAAQHREEIHDEAEVLPTVAAAAPPRPPQAADTLPVTAAREAAEEQRRVTKAARPREAAKQVESGTSLAAEIRTQFDAHLLSGGDPSDPALAGDIATRLGVTPAYVRRLIKPLREDSLQPSQK